MRSFIEGCRQILFPVTCIYCQKRLQGGLAWLCLECHATLRKCKPIGVNDFNRALAPGLLLGFALWEFHKNQPVQRLQHHLKYKKMPRIGLDLGRMMGDAFSVLLKKRSLALPDHILPIPLHRRRFLERGYNQSSMLARAMASSLGCACTEGLLIRTRPTRTQTGLSRQERQDNLEGAFALHGGHHPKRPAYSPCRRCNDNRRHHAGSSALPFEPIPSWAEYSGSGPRPDRFIFRGNLEYGSYDRPGINPSYHWSRR